MRKSNQNQNTEASRCLHLTVLSQLKFEVGTVEGKYNTCVKDDYIHVI